MPLVDRDQKGQLSITCPTCRQVTPIPARGVGGLQSAFHIGHLLEIQDSVKKLTVEIGKAASTPLREACSEHPDEELKLYCETCEKLVCFHCIMKDSKHHDHEYSLVKKAIEKHREEIVSALEPMEKRFMTAKKALAQLDIRCEEILDQRAMTKENVVITFRRLRKILHIRERELIGQLNHITEVKLNGLSSQREQVEITLAQLGSSLHLLRESLVTENERYMLRIRSNTVKQIKELTIPSQPDSFQPTAEADILFPTPEDVTEVYQNYGKVFALGLIHPNVTLWAKEWKKLKLDHVQLCY